MTGKLSKFLAIAAAVIAGAVGISFAALQPAAAAFTSN
jgi:hypothetical protein